MLTEMMQRRSITEMVPPRKPDRKVLDALGRIGNSGAVRVLIAAASYAVVLGIVIPIAMQVLPGLDQIG